MTILPQRFLISKKIVLNRWIFQKMTVTKRRKIARLLLVKHPSVRIKL
jgi:hypothetical protein